MVYSPPRPEEERVGALLRLGVLPEDRLGEALRLGVLLGV